ncbi:MAG: hypothetical protein HY705_01500 [Gemmatimonadetes bacterium]|nr:hypothetical protein [Gemmatimonadota bacterium]
MLHLERFGFTATQRRVYEALLAIGPSTGYAVARAAGVARANAYHALDGLVRRGAARLAETKPARYVALAPAELLGRIGRSWQRDLATLETELQALPRREAPAALAAFELLHDREPLVAGAGACADHASRELLAVVGPWVQALYPALERARQRRVNVRALSLGSPAPPGGGVRPVGVEELLAYWGGFPIALVADRVNAVCGIIAEDGSASGFATAEVGVVPFVRHLLRRELAASFGARLSSG